MATEKTTCDALGWYLTGATSDGGGQLDPDESLGGSRSALEMRQMGVLVNPITQISPIAIDNVIGENVAGAGEIRAASTSTLEYKCPGGSAFGTAATVTNGSTVLLLSDDTDKAIRVSRDKSESLAGYMPLTIVKQVHSVLGMDNITSAERAAGNDTYRAIMWRAHGGNALSALKVWVGTLGTQATSDGGQLGAAGGGTITTTGSYADWPDYGWAHITTDVPATREIVYYTSRTATVLTVPAAGRGLLGTGAAAGAATDTVDAVPGIRLALEAPDGDGNIQTIANESTAPAAVAWDSGITSASGLSLANLASGSNYGLWIHREIPTCAVAQWPVVNEIQAQFIESAVTYNSTITGRYGIANTALALYELYVGEDADPDFTAAPDETNATLPFTHALAAAPGGTEVEYRYTCRLRDKYNLVSFNTYWRRATIDDAGDEVLEVPTAPVDTTFAHGVGTTLQAMATYNKNNDTNPADYFALYFSGDGDAPNTSTDTRVDVAMGAGMMGRQYRKLDYGYGPNATGEEIQVLVRSRRASDGAQSTNTSAVTAAVTQESIAVPGYPRGFLGQTFGYSLPEPTISRTIVIDAGDNIYWQMEVGYTELWADTVLLFRLKYDSNEPANNGLWTTAGFTQSAISGAAGGNPVDVASATLLYITVGGDSAPIRRMELDASVPRIKCAALNQVPADVVTSHSSDPIFETPWNSCFQVYDPATLDYQTAMSLDTTGVLSMKVGWRQRAVVGDFG
ncbi:MAG: hypothetical protein GY832_22040 [Chloroflexi bacterium]|nr:hypothetical protein [Chloroflexota bacterium]